MHLPPKLAGRLRQLCIAGALAAVTAPALAEPPRPPRGPLAMREIVVVNRSRHAIQEIYVSPATADQWGNDRLGDDTVDPGGSFRVRLGRSRECSFDIQVIYDDASREESRGLDICRTRQVSFNGSAAIVPPDAFAAEHEVTLVNRSERPIQQVFISSSSADQWGEDRLTQDDIAPDHTRSITYRGACTSDLRIVFDNRSAEERRALDLCATPALVIRPGWTTEDVPQVPHATRQPPDAAAGRVVLVANRSGSAVTEFYLFPEDAPPGAMERSHDLLGNAVLPQGGRIVLPFSRGSACRFAARVGHGGDRTQQELTGIDLCRSAEVTVPPAQ
ncbi:hypothetical protein [Limobrevibacterium gyesilva]|uniref:Uncharacterized protein n=1 Tax=Limobrevibacterium gyesilva TaxID=2991712 RepID=A0AA41YSX5_9PROT|nr:hypothetical protein [Limobrevibacterium gyesilva]MCW3477748.1 hypothetical protein [Limobrevibacterium gyesilva]